MARRRLTKVEQALRQELANTIHDMDDGKLESNRLHELINKINSKLYNETETSDEEEYEERPTLLPTVSNSYDDYVDNLYYPDGDLSYQTEDITADLRYAIEELSFSTNKKQITKHIKKVEKHFTKYVKAMDTAAKDLAKEYKECVGSADKQLKKLKADIAKDLKPKKKSKNANKSTLL